MARRTMGDDMLRYRIVNTVLSTRITGFIDIEKLALFLTGTQYEPEVFPGLIMRRPDLKATLVLFSTGRYVSMSKSVAISSNALEVIAGEISKIEKRNIEFESPNVENIVATSDVGHEIELDKLRDSNSCCIYESEQFPGAICRVRNSIVLLVFKSGKVNCVGCKTEEEIIEALIWLKERISQIQNYTS